MRLSQIARKFNVSTDTIILCLKSRKIAIDVGLNTKITPEQLALLKEEFRSAIETEEGTKDTIKKEIVTSDSQDGLSDRSPTVKEEEKIVKSEKEIPEELPSQKLEVDTPRIPVKEKVAAVEKVEVVVTKKEEKKVITKKPSGYAEFKILGSIELAKKPDKKFLQVTSSDKKSEEKPSFVKKGHKKSIMPPKRKFSKPPFTYAVHSTRKKHRKEKKSHLFQQKEADQMEQQNTSLKIVEFITTKELGALMKVSIQDILDASTKLGRTISINQRLDKEIIILLADGFKQKIEFISIEETKEQKAVTTNLQPRAPIIVIMGHVDHGKTSLLDYIRKTHVVEREVGGITQHIGASEIQVTDTQRIVCLDTPGHQAFTAMRARGTELTDLAIIVIAADDGIMPQTKEAISHAQLAGIPIIIAINKIDIPAANPDRVKNQLADMDILVEELGGNYQCQHISAKTGEGVQELLEKVLLEAEILGLQADPDQKVQGAIIEASLEYGRGYLTNLMVQEGSLYVGDVLLAGSYFGKVKAIFNSQGEKIKKAGPATPVQVLGFNGTPQSGEAFRVMPSEREARELAIKYKDVRHQQSLRAKKKQINTFEEIDLLQKESLNTLHVIIKGDTNGSVEALADILLALSVKDVRISVPYQGVGPISESDVLLASNLKAFIIGFHTKVAGAKVKSLAARENVDIQLHNLIHEAVQAAEEKIEEHIGPQTEEILHGTAIVIQTFQVARIGRIAGCHIKKGSIKQDSQVRFIRNGEVIYQGPIKKLEVEKEKVKEAKEGVQCAFSLRNFNDAQVDDIVEAFEIKKV